jgi:hypothetical protein
MAALPEESMPTNVSLLKGVSIAVTVAITAALAVAVACAPRAEGWLLKAPYEAKAQYAWDINFKLNFQGSESAVSMRQHLTIDSATDKEVKGKGGWTDFRMNGKVLPASEFESLAMVLSPAGGLLDVGKHGAYARMFAPLMFIYPGKEVKAGDKWTTKFKPGVASRDAEGIKEMTYDYEVVCEEKVGDVDALRVKAKLTEDGPMRGNNVYWVGKDGKVLKFEADLQKWGVFIGGNAVELDAKLMGDLVKGK